VSLLCAVIEPPAPVLICALDLLKYSYGCVMFDIDPASEAGQAIKALRDAIPEEELMAKGREEEPHCTVRYGIMDTASEAGIASYLTAQSPFTVTLGKTIVFPPTDHSDGAAVVVIELQDSNELNWINEELGEHGTFKKPDFEYHPHITLAYVTPEAAAKWADNPSLEGVELLVDTIVISSAKDDAKTPIALTGTVEKIAPRGARFTCPKCGQYIPYDSQTCANCAPGTGPLISSPTEGMSSTPDETNPTSQPGNLPAPSSLGVKQVDDPAVVDNPESGANNVGVSGKDNAMAAAADRSENPYGSGTAKILLCGSQIDEDDDEEEDEDGILAKFNENHRPAGSSGGGQFDFNPAGFHETGLKLKPTTKRAFNGKQVPVKLKLDKDSTGKLGENIVIRHLQMQGMDDARKAVTKGNHFAIDVVQDHGAIEVKTGLVSNAPKSQQWRVTFSTTPAQQQMINGMTPEARKAYNAGRLADAMKRKEVAARAIAGALGIKGVSKTTMAVLVNADTRTADVFSWKGFHERIGWTSDMMKKGFVKSYTY